MKKLESFITSSNFFVLYLYVAAFSIFSFGAENGKYAVKIMVTICVILLILKLVKIQERKRKKGFKVLISIVFFASLSAYSLGAGVANEKISAVFLEKDPNIEDKARFVLSKVHQMPQHKEMQRTEKDGVVFFHTEESAKDIERAWAIIQEKKKIWDELLGENNIKLAVQFTNDEYIKEGIGERNGERAAFLAENNTIYINGEDEELDYVMHHEYVHFRVNAFNSEEKSKEERIPQWFDEGLADSAAGSMEIGYARLPEIKNPIELEKMQDNVEFHAEREKGGDTYLQSFVIVRKMINEYGFPKVAQLAKVESRKQFYEEFEKLTGKTPAEYQSES